MSIHSHEVITCNTTRNKYSIIIIKTKQVHEDPRHVAIASVQSEKTCLKKSMKKIIIIISNKSPFARLAIGLLVSNA